MSLWERTKEQEAMWWALGISIALHIVMLLLQAPRVWGDGAGTATAPFSGRARPFDVTLVPRVDQRQPDMPDASVGLASSVPDSTIELTASADTETTIFANTRSTREVVHRPSVESSSGYLIPDQLTVQPELIEMGDLDLPGVVTAGDKGHLILELRINEEGRVDAIRTIENTVPPKFYSNALRVFEWARFEPGREINRNARALLQIKIILDASVSAPGAFANIRQQRIQVAPVK